MDKKPGRIVHNLHCGWSSQTTTGFCYEASSSAQFCEQREPMKWDWWPHFYQATDREHAGSTLKKQPLHKCIYRKCFHCVWIMIYQIKQNLMVLCNLIKFISIQLLIMIYGCISISPILVFFYCIFYAFDKTLRRGPNLWILKQKESSKIL